MVEKKRPRARSHSVDFIDDFSVLSQASQKVKQRKDKEKKELPSLISGVQT